MVVLFFRSVCSFVYMSAFFFLVKHVSVAIDNSEYGSGTDILPYFNCLFSIESTAWHLMRHDVCNGRGLTVEVHGPGDCVFVFQSSLFSSVMANS